MTYRVYVGNWGSECVAGEIPDNIWKYIQDECDGDASVYRDKLDEGEVPEEFRLAEDTGTFYDASSFFQEYGPYSDAEIQVQDEQHHEVLKVDCKDVEKITDELNAATKAKHYFVWESVEKGWWYADVETDEPFDKSKLKIHVYRIEYNDTDSAMEFIPSISYNDEDYYLEPETEGKSYELSFYDK